MISNTSSGLNISEEREWIPIPGHGQGWVREDWHQAFAEAGLKSINDFLEDHGEALSKPDLGNRYRARIQIKRDGAIHTVYLKRYGRESISTRIKRWYEDGGFTTPAHRDVRTAQALHAKGISVPKTLAWGFQTNSKFGQRSFVISAQVPGNALDRAFEDSAAKEHFRSFAERKKLTEETAALAKLFHGAGWCHRDFYLCHLFIEFRGSSRRFSIIDLQRAFRPRWRAWRWRVKDLAQLNYSAKSKFVSRSMRLRFAKAYFGTNRLTAFHKSALRSIQRKSNSIARHDRALMS